MRAWRVLHVAVLATVPTIVGGILFFGGGQVDRCLALTCPPRPPRPSYLVIGGTDPVVALAICLAFGWIVLALATVARLMVRDRPRLARIVAILVTASVIAAGAIATVLRRDGHRWRDVAETAALGAAAVAYVLLPPLLAWTAAARRPPSGLTGEGTPQEGPANRPSTHGPRSA